MANELIKRNGSTRRNTAAVSTLAMGALTVSQGVQAALIVQDVGQTVATGQTVAVDLFDAAGAFRQDGLDDFEFSVTATSAQVDSLQGNTYNFFVDNGGSGVNAKQFASGDVIGAATLDKHLYFGRFYSGSTNPNPAESGYWGFGDTGFLGIRFDLSGAIHYGWLEITVGSLTINRIGFETVAGAAAGTEPAKVPEPAGLSLLAAGAAGAAGLLAFRRRKREANAEAA